MADDKELRELLILIFEHLKQQRSELSSALAEVAAVRDALIEIGPKYDGIVTRHRSRHVKETRPVLDEIIQKYDEIIERLR